MTAAFEDNEGSAKRMADTMTNTLDGAIKRIESATEGVQLQMAETFAPAIITVLESWTTVFTKLGNAITGTKDALEKFEGMGKRQVGLTKSIITLEDKLTKLESKRRSQLSGDTALDAEITTMKTAIKFIKQRIENEKDLRKQTLLSKGITREPSAEIVKKLEDVTKPPKPPPDFGKKDTSLVQKRLKEQEQFQKDFLAALANEEKISQEIKLENITNTFDREREIVKREMDLRLEQVLEGTQLETEIRESAANKITKIEKDASELRKDIAMQELEVKGQIANNLLGAAQSVLANEKGTAAAQKALAIARVVFSTGVAIMKTIALQGPFSIPLAFSIGAIGAAQIAKISATKFQLGGVAPGFGQQDTVPALLTPGERVVSGRELGNVGGLPALEEFLRSNVQNGGGQVARISVAEGSGPMQNLVRQMLPFMKIEIERA